MNQSPESQPTLQDLARLVQEQQRQIAALQKPAPTKPQFSGRKHPLAFAGL